MVEIKLGNGIIKIKRGEFAGMPTQVHITYAGQSINFQLTNMERKFLKDKL